MSASDDFYLLSLTCRLQYQELRQGSAAPARNSANEPDLLSNAAWQTLATEWAAIEAVSSHEFLFAQEINAATTHRIKLRYRPGRSARGRFQYVDPYNSNQERIFNIASIITKDEGAPVYQICLCIE